MALTGACLDRIELIKAAIEVDVSKQSYHGGCFRVSLGSEVIMDAAIGSADEKKAKPLSFDSVFNILSITKAFVNVLTLRNIEMGRYALTTRVNEIIPEFSGAPRDQSTFFHLLTHTTGMPGVWLPRPNMCMDDFDEMLDAVLNDVHGNVEPGERCDYSPVSNHILLGEALRRCDPKKRSFRDIMREELFEPLGMKDTAIGLRADLKDRHVALDVRGHWPIKARGHTQPGDYGAFEEEFGEMPHVGAVSTVENLWRFAEMLQRGGEFDGTRILSPRTISLARKNWTGELYNEIYRTVALRAGWRPPPANLGLGFNVRGDGIMHHQFGTLASSETFGNYGGGSAVYWIDPETSMTFVCLTAGLLSQAANIERFQRLSDIATSAVS